MFGGERVYAGMTDVHRLDMSTMGWTAGPDMPDTGFYEDAEGTKGYRDLSTGDGADLSTMEWASGPVPTPFYKYYGISYQASCMIPNIGMLISGGNDDGLFLRNSSLLAECDGAWKWVEMPLADIPPTAMISYAAFNVVFEPQSCAVFALCPVDEFDEPDEAAEVQSLLRLDCYVRCCGAAVVVVTLLCCAAAVSAAVVVVVLRCTERCCGGAAVLLLLRCCDIAAAAVLLHCSDAAMLW